MMNSSGFWDLISFQIGCGRSWSRHEPRPITSSPENPLKREGNAVLILSILFILSLCFKVEQFLILFMNFFQ